MTSITAHTSSHIRASSVGPRCDFRGGIANWIFYRISGLETRIGNREARV